MIIVDSFIQIMDLSSSIQRIVFGNIDTTDVNRSANVVFWFLGPSGSGKSTAAQAALDLGLRAHDTDAFGHRILNADKTVSWVVDARTLSKALTSGDLIFGTCSNLTDVASYISDHAGGDGFKVVFIRLGIGSHLLTSSDSFFSTRKWLSQLDEEQRMAANAQRLFGEYFSELSTSCAYVQGIFQMKGSTPPSREQSLAIGQSKRYNNFGVDTPLRLTLDIRSVDKKYLSHLVVLPSWYSSEIMDMPFYEVPDVPSRRYVVPSQGGGIDIFANFASMFAPYSSRIIFAEHNFSASADWALTWCAKGIPLQVIGKNITLHQHAGYYIPSQGQFSLLDSNGRPYDALDPFGFTRFEFGAGSKNVDVSAINTLPSFQPLRAFFDLFEAYDPFELAAKLVPDYDTSSFNYPFSL